MAKDETFEVSRDFLIEVLGTVESLLVAAQSNAERLTAGQVAASLDALGLVDAIQQMLWGRYGSGPEGRL